MLLAKVMRRILYARGYNRFSTLSFGTFAAFPSSGRGSLQHSKCDYKRIKAIISTLFICGVYSICFAESSRQLASCDGNEEVSGQNNLEPAVLEIDELFSGPEEEEYWEKSKRECPFCNQFLSSPCKEDFKLWSKCVDIAKARGVDFTLACRPYSRALMNCTMNHPEHFPVSSEKKDDEEEDEEEQEEDNEAGQDDAKNSTSKPGAEESSDGSD